jgi:hypothetical protein
MKLAADGLQSAPGRPFAIKEGLMAAEAVDILKDFYVQTNPNAPVPKPKVGRERQQPTQ